MLIFENQPTKSDKNRQTENAEKSFSSVKKEISKIYYNRMIFRAKIFSVEVAVMPVTKIDTFLGEIVSIFCN